MNTPEWTHPPTGGVPEYKPSVDEKFGGIPAHAPATPLEDRQQRGLDEALEEQCDDGER
ncbi:MAG: hypothetical protein ABSB50_03235 [Terracidiphilus sp.]|jgi:hypothetical protein